MENIGKSKIQVRNEKRTVYLYNLLSDQLTLWVYALAKAHQVVHFSKSF